MDGIYKKFEEYNPNKKPKILIVFDDIADMLNYKKLNQTVTELFIRRRKLNISLAFITQFYRKHSFVMKIANKRELQQIAFNYSSGIDFQDFLVIDTTLTSDNSSRFRKDLLERI